MRQQCSTCIAGSFCAHWRQYWGWGWRGETGHGAGRNVVERLQKRVDLVMMEPRILSFLFGSLPPPLYPWTCTSYRAGGGSRRPIAEWDANRTDKGI